MMRQGRRRLLAWSATALVAAVGSGSAAAQPAERPPLVNLRIELRQVEAEQRQSAGIEGAVRSGPGGVSGSVALDAREGAGERASQQQLLVLNGGRGGIRLAQARPLQWLQAVPVSPGTVAWVPGTVWVDAGQGFTVRPRWPGGAAPVSVEVAAEGGGLEGLSSGREGPRSSQVLTTLQLPLGDWVTVAESAEAQQREQGRWAARRDSGSRRLLVQMRVTLP